MSPEKVLLDELKIDRARAPRRAPILSLLAFVVTIAAAAGGAFAWYNYPKTTPLRVLTVKETVIGGGKTLLNSSGYVTARRQATVASKVTGRVMEVLVEEGMKVEAGQVLSRIDSSNVEKSLKLAQAQLSAAKEAVDETRVSLELAESELRRFTELARENITTPLELDRAQASVSSMKARLQRQNADIEVAEREVELWKQQMDDTIILAPFAGVVTEKNAQPGEIISVMSAGGGFTRTGICTIVDMNSLEIEVDVSESYINRVIPGQPVEATLDSYPDWKIPCKVIAIIPTADRQKATVKVRIGFEAIDPRILPDMSVKVAFLSAVEEEAVQRSISVPKSAIRQDGENDIVWVVDEGKARKRIVSVAGTSGDEATIASGIVAGENIVLDVPESLVEGEPVTEAQP
ncbi:MAG: RND transporter [Candidatus Hydrogenedentota bacterium]